MPLQAYLCVCSILSFQMGVYRFLIKKKQNKLKLIVDMLLFRSDLKINGFFRDYFRTPIRLPGPLLFQVASSRGRQACPWCRRHDRGWRAVGIFIRMFLPMFTGITAVPLTVKGSAFTGMPMTMQPPTAVSTIF